MSVTLRGEPGDALALATERKIRAIRDVSVLREQGVPLDDPRLVAAYAEWHATDDEIQQWVQAAVERVPGERYGLRNRGLYVDVTFDTGKVSWKRPNEVTHDEARDALMDALNDYRLIRGNLEPPFVAFPEVGGSPTFAAALAAWSDKPALPEAPLVRYRSAVRGAPLTESHG